MNTYYCGDILGPLIGAIGAVLTAFISGYFTGKSKGDTITYNGCTFKDGSLQTAMRVKGGKKNEQKG